MPTNAGRNRSLHGQSSVDFESLFLPKSVQGNNVEPTWETNADGHIAANGRSKTNRSVNYEEAQVDPKAINELRCTKNKYNLMH